MNISPVSFGNTHKYGSGVQRNYRAQSRYEDEFVSTRKPKAKSHKTKNNNQRLKALIMSGIGILTAGAIYNECTDKDIPKPVDIPTSEIHDYVSLEELAENYNSTVNIIYDYNDVDSVDEVKDKDSIKVPYSYDFIDKKIEKLQEKLFSSKLNEEKRNELEKEIESLKEKKEMQDSIAEVYSDGKYVYFNILPLSEDAPKSAKELCQYDSINVEDFKELFDIKDEAIRKYNKLSYSWESDNPEYGYYKDYSGALIHCGDTIKVPVRAMED